MFAAIADADGVLLERALIERGCAAHLESLETLADAADAFAEERSDRLESEKEENHATSARSAFRADALASADAALDVERNREIETSDGDTTVDIARAQAVPFRERMPPSSPARCARMPIGGGTPPPRRWRRFRTLYARAKVWKRLRKRLLFLRRNRSRRRFGRRSNPRGASPRRASRTSPRRWSRTWWTPRRRCKRLRANSATGASGTGARAWPSPVSTASPGAHGDTTPASIAIARARLIGARVRAMVADADGAADAVRRAATMPRRFQTPKTPPRTISRRSFRTPRRSPRF